MASDLQLFSLLLAFPLSLSFASVPSSNTIELVFSSGRHSFTRTLPCHPETETAGDLLEMVAKTLGLHRDYLVLWKDSGLLDTAGRVKNRRNSDRIGWNSMWPDADALNAQKLTSLGVTAGSLVHCAVRPLRGDHIHQAFAMYVHGELVDILWDQAWLRTPDANEGNTYPQSFSDLSSGMWDYHITTTHPHFGVHAGQAYWFGDGLIHSHPGTAWQWFTATEGLGCTLQAYLEQVGAAMYDGASSRYPVGQWHVPMHYRDLEQNAVTIPDKTGGKTTMVGGEYACEASNANEGLNGQNTGASRHPVRDFETFTHTAIEMTPENVIIHSNSTHKWRVYYWDYFTSSTPRVLEYGASELWLGENLGMVVMSFEPRDADTSNPPRPPSCMIDILADKQGRETGTSITNQQSSYYIKGFDGYPYPMPNDHGEGWPQPKKIYIDGMDTGPLL